MSDAAKSARADRLVIAVVVACSVSGTLMQALDSTIVNVALPYMQGSLSASRDQVVWVLTSYMVASAIMTPPVSWLAGRYGIRDIYIGALAGFTIASCLCGMAMNMGEIVLFRALQGTFGAALVPLSMSILVKMFPPEKLAQPMALWGMGLMLGPILGPTLGGFLTEYYSWRWCFYVNVPFGVITIAGVWFFFRIHEDKKRMQFDWIGFALLSLALGTFQMLLDRGTDQDWFSSNEIITYAVLAGLGGYLFLFHMFTAKTPFLPRAMFRDRNLVLSALLIFVIMGVLMSGLSLMPTYLQSVSDRPVVNAGLLLGPRGFGVMAAMFVCGRIANRVDPRRIMSLGAVLLALTLWDMAHWPGFVGSGRFLFITIVQGVGMGLSFNPLMVIGFATISKSLHNDGTMFVSLVRNVSGAIGISLATVVLTNATQTIREQATAVLTPINQALMINSSSLMLNYHLPSGVARLNAVLQAYVAPLAYGNAYMFLFWPTVALLPLIWLFRRPAYSMSGMVKKQTGETHVAAEAK